MKALATLQPCRTHSNFPSVDSWTSAIFIDEFHPRCLEHAADGLIVDPGELGLAGGEFGTADGGDADFGLGGELLGTPSDERSGGPDLGAGERLGGHLDITSGHAHLIPFDLFNTVHDPSAVSRKDSRQDW